MKRTALLLTAVLLLVAACSKEAEGPERTFPLTGTILGRDAARNTLTIQHEEIKGYMEAMTMSFPLEGAKVGDVPPDGSRVTATLHVTDRSYWVSDVKPAS